MSKVYSGYMLLSVLAFSTAHTPTFVASRDLPIAQFGAAEHMPVLPSEDTLEPFEFAGLSREYSEADELRRLGVDQFYLPSLEVTLPELFEWSDAERMYLAQLDRPITVDIGHALDSASTGAFHAAGYSHSFGRGLASGGGAIAGGGSSKQSAGSNGGSSANSSAGEFDTESPAPVASDRPTSTLAGSSDRDRASNGDENSQSSAPEDSDPLPDAPAPLLVDSGGASEEGDTQAPSAPDQLAYQPNPSDDDGHGGGAIDWPTPLPPNDSDLSYWYEPIMEREPVAVPAPGGLPLFALGLAGLLWTSRKRNRSG